MESWDNLAVLEMVSVLAWPDCGFQGPASSTRVVESCLRGQHLLVVRRKALLDTIHARKHSRGVWCS